MRNKLISFNHLSVKKAKTLHDVVLNEGHVQQG